ncbi:MAG: mechanosensitive ion channel family protein, partial [Planctomycetota bacterium]
IESSGGPSPVTDAGAGTGDAGGAAVDTLGQLTDVPTDLEGLAGWIQVAQDKLIEFLPSLFAAVVILVLGWLVSKLITSLVRKALGKGKLDGTLINFLASMLYMLLMMFVVISAITKLGVNTTSFVAILGAAGFAIGFAMQGSLSNFAAGVMMMIFRPIRQGDLVEAGGVLGKVGEVGVFATVINTLENKKAIIANSSITGGNIINYTANGMLRVDMTFGIGYGDDIDKAISIMRGILDADERVLKEPAHTVALYEHGDSSVNFVCRPYVTPENYWAVWFDTHAAVKKAFDEQGVSIPFPQRDVHLFKESA